MAIIKFLNKKFNVEIKDEVDRSVTNEIFKFREYRSAEDFIKLNINPIFDIGAHIGLFSLYVRALNQTVPLVAFEPEPNNFTRLEKTINDNKLSNIQLEPLALSTDSGQEQLIVSSDSHNHHLKNSSDNISGQQIIKVKTISLLDYCQKNKIKKVGLLKLDIEGTEFNLLKNWDKKTFQLCDSILMEYHNNQNNNHKELISLLKENHFGVQNHPSHFDKTMGFIWATKK